MQRAMWQEKDLTYQKALELFMSTKLATKDISLLQQKPVEVKRIHTGQQSRLKRSKYTSCCCCGGNHSLDTCRFKTTECRFCKKIGHIPKVKVRKTHLVKRDSNSIPLEPPYKPQTPQEGYTLFTTVGGGKPIVLTVNETR